MPTMKHIGMWLRRAVFGFDIALWIAWSVLQVGWAGHRPLAPQGPFTHAFLNHGVMFVSDADLAWSNGLLAAALMFLPLAVWLNWEDIRASRDADDARWRVRQGAKVPKSWRGS
jgi:hypothetical protein